MRFHNSRVRSMSLSRRPSHTSHDEIITISIENIRHQWKWTQMSTVSAAHYLPGVRWWVFIVEFSTRARQLTSEGPISQWHAKSRWVSETTAIWHICVASPWYHRSNSTPKEKIKRSTTPSRKWRTRCHQKAPACPTSSCSPSKTCPFLRPGMWNARHSSKSLPDCSARRS